MIIKIIIALLVFMVVVVVHEFGHFIFAKRAKIKVNEFSVGMGPKIFGTKRRYIIFYQSFTIRRFLCYGR